MKYAFLLLFSCCLSGAFSQNNPSAYQQLCRLNAEWNKKACPTDIIHDQPMDECDTKLIRKHLFLVEKSLRMNTPEGLNEKQLNNRIKCLDILQSYYEREIFPINLYHRERTPYFIDHLGTACAVGHLIIETGFPEISNKIKEENNYGYVHNLVKKYPSILEWANEYGFTEDELAWIQPTYGGGCTVSGGGMVIYTSCSSACDGIVVLPEPALTPPYTISGPSCSQLCPGNYNWVFFDGVGNSVTYSATIGSMYTVTYSLTPSACSAPGSCDGSITATPTSGTPPFVYTLFDSTMTPISSGADSVFTGLCAGEYYVTVTDANGCSESAVSSTVTEPGLGFEILMAKNIKLFPNPASEMVTLQGTDIDQVMVYGIDGKLILNNLINHQNQITLDLSGMEKGTYLVFTYSGQNYQQNLLVVK